MGQLGGLQAARLEPPLSAGLPLVMVNDRNKRGIHTVRGRLGSPRTPMIAFNSVIVTCLARSTACATCCWCCGDRHTDRSELGTGLQVEAQTPISCQPFFVYILLMRAGA